MIAKTNPEYILVRNNAGYTPLQILCKNGRIDERIISTFAQMGGPDIFTVKDATGNTPLHSAMRKKNNLHNEKHVPHKTRGQHHKRGDPNSRRLQL